MPEKKAERKSYTVVFTPLASSNLIGLVEDFLRYLKEGNNMKQLEKGFSQGEGLICSCAAEGLFQIDETDFHTVSRTFI